MAKLQILFIVHTRTYSGAEHWNEATFKVADSIPATILKDGTVVQKRTLKYQKNITSQLVQNAK